MSHDLSARAHELRALLVPFISKRVDSQDVDDVLQNVFVRIQRGLGELRESDKVVAWSYQIARNVIVDHTRRRSVRKHEPLDRLRSVAAPHEENDDSGATELALILGHFIAILSDPYREALQLTELRGMTQAEAAQRVGLSVPGMKSRVQRARAQLRELLEGCCDIELDTRGSIIDVDPNNPPTDLPNCCAPAPAGADAGCVKDTVQYGARVVVGRDLVRLRAAAADGAGAPVDRERHARRIAVNRYTALREANKLEAEPPAAGVHGDETSGVHGALQLIQRQGRGRGGTRRR